MVHPDISADWDIPETIHFLSSGLESIGYTVSKVPYTPTIIKELYHFNGIVFNICEMYGGAYREALIPSLCELLDVNYVFSQPDVMLKTLDKNICNFIVKKMGIHVPEWCYVSHIEDLIKLKSLVKYPYIVKPSHEGSGIGISNKAIVYNYQELLDRAKYVIESYQRPIIVQRYIFGTEVTIGIAGTIEHPTVFKLVEIELLDSLVYGISEKENAHHRAKYLPFQNAKIEAEVNNVTKLIYKSLNCRDGARIDFRIEKDTMIPYFIEINPLPHLHPEIGDFCRSASMADYSYESLLNLIMSSAQKRFTRRK
ncbi:MAG: D-alanine-D-alanine ligase / aminopeptidase [Bacteroidota bacterium]|jgi:D-alanine-D-alanine ligase